MTIVCRGLPAAVRCGSSTRAQPPNRFAAPFVVPSHPVRSSTIPSLRRSPRVRGHHVAIARLEDLQRAERDVGKRTTLGSGKSGNGPTWQHASLKAKLKSDDKLQTPDFKPSYLVGR